MLFVYIENIRKNIQKIKKEFRKDIIAVVKSNCYGFGKKMVKHFVSCGINYYFVNRIEEYLDFKDVLKNQNVIIMEPCKVEKNDKIIYTLNGIEEVKKFKNINYDVRVHLQIDLGMKRLGIKTKEELQKILVELKHYQNIKIEGIYGHNPFHVFDKINYEIIKEKFLSFSTLYPFKMIHLSSTSSLDKEIIGTHVRVGLGLYGYGNPFMHFYPTVSFKTRILSSHYVEKKEVVGYQKLKIKKIKHPLLIGVIPLGYNDVPFLYKCRIGNIKIAKYGRSCMNHTHLLLNDEINKRSFVTIIKKNDIILTEMMKINNNPLTDYQILISIQNTKKGWIDNEIKQISKRKMCRSKKIRLRRTSNQIISLRTIRLFWC